MAKPPLKSKGASTAPTEVVVNYDLHDLPTAFHKAGLAGLVMLIDSLTKRQLLGNAAEDVSVSETGVEIRFTESMVQHLMDDVYDAEIVEVATKARWQGADIKREEISEEEHEGKKTRTKRFIYDVVQPKGTFLQQTYQDSGGLWLKLWRDMLWNIPRARPTTRESFNQRANGVSCKEGHNGWAELLKVAKARIKGGCHTSEISSALLPGAQAVNAEGVPFVGRAEENLLLHFWPLAVLLFVPQAVEADGSSDFVGYTLAVPDIANLKHFLSDYPALLHALPGDARGYRPAQAVIDMPAEGALSLLDHLAVITGLHVERGELRYSVRAVEYLHLAKMGNNVKTMASGRVTPTPNLIAAYRQIVAPSDASTRVRNSLFRRGLLLALLDSQHWYQPFRQMFETFHAEVFLRQKRSPESEGKGPAQFAVDASRKIRHLTDSHLASQKRNNSMRESEPSRTPPPVIVNRVVRSYLLSRAKDKTNIDPSKFQTPDGDIDYKAVPSDFNEAKQKLAQSLFLEFRSRKDQAFVDHFAATFFSTTQRLSESDRLEMAEMLTVVDRRDDLKTLTLLSLSANS